MSVTLSEVRYISETSITIRKARRRMTIPKEIIDHFGLEDGDHFIWVLLKDDSLSLVPKKLDDGVSARDSDKPEGKV